LLQPDVQVASKEIKSQRGVSMMMICVVLVVAVRVIAPL
jgi:hypothetical protein